MIEISRLDKRYGQTTVLDGISLDIPEGTNATIMGPSGSGKTTLLRLIAGLETPEAGEIFLNRRLASTRNYLLAPYKREIGMVFQHSALWPHLTVAENIGFGISREKKAARNRRVDELCERMEIDHIQRVYPDKISGGQARRVALARALAPRPRFLLLDEPLTNIEERLQNELLAYLRDEQNQHGFTIVYVTHDNAKADALPGPIWLLEDGNIKPLSQ